MTIRGVLDLLFWASAPVHVRYDGKTDWSSGVLLGWNGDGHTAYGEGSSCVDTIVNAYLISLKVPRSGTLCPASGP